MARLLKCYGDCNSKYLREELIEYNSKRYCNNCIEKVRDKAENRPTLIRAISNYIGEYPSGMILKQIKDMEEKDGFSYRGMINALLYYHEVKHNTLNPQMGINILKYVYSDAQVYYRQKEKIKEREKNKKPWDLGKDIIIKQPQEKNTWREKTLNRIENRSKKTEDLCEEIKNREKKEEVDKKIITKKEIEELKNNKEIMETVRENYPENIPLLINGKFINQEEIDEDRKGIYAYFYDLGYTII